MKKTVLAALIAVTALPAMPAAADPPRWAPAHGWRDHHRYDRYDDDRRYYRTDNGITLVTREMLSQFDPL